jgi:F0F1-type ATP synthase assembly protein I
MPMKPDSPPDHRLFEDDGTLHGVDVALTVAAFFAIGFFLDRWLGTTPWLMIGFTVLAGVGFFAKYKYRYDADMERHQAQRQARVSGDRVEEEQSS